MSYDYFCYDPETGFETHNTTEGAKQAAEDAIDYYRDHADEGWSEEVTGVCWGKILQRTVETASFSASEAKQNGIYVPSGFSGVSEYGLIDINLDEHDSLTEENKRLRDLLKKINEGNRQYIDDGKMHEDIENLLSDIGGER